MITIKIDDQQVKALLKALPKKAGRAAEQALDFTAVRIGDAVRTQMLRRFDNPTQFTINSLKVTKTRNHNMTAIVGFKEPARMSDHYLVPQVDGGRRKLKGFERHFSEQFVPGRGATLDASGNIKPTQLKNILKAVKSKTKGTRQYVYLPKGSGSLPPGVYQRFITDRAATKGRGFRLQMGRQSQVSKIRSAVQPRGLKPVLIKGRTGKAVRPLLPFYEIASAEYDRRFLPAFTARFNALMR